MVVAPTQERRILGVLPSAVRGASADIERRNLEDLSLWYGSIPLLFVHACRMKVALEGAAGNVVMRAR